MHATQWEQQLRLLQTLLMHQTGSYLWVPLMDSLAEGSGLTEEVVRERYNQKTKAKTSKTRQK